MIRKNTKKLVDKQVDRVERRAANRQGITYGARMAGAAPEHSEIGHGKHATHSSAKHVAGRRTPRRKREQRITSG